MLKCERNLKHMNNLVSYTKLKPNKQIYSRLFSEL